MDNEELVSYYLKKSQDWIFIPQFRNIKIEDDEILDLDSMDLDSNEDTWLYSSSEKSLLNDSQKSMEHEELEKEFGSNNEIESKKEKEESFSPLSPLLGPEDFQHPSFLNSMDEMSDSAFEDLLRTPLTSRSKSNLLRKALSNNHSRSDFNVTTNAASGESVSGSFSCAAATVIAARETTSAVEIDPVFKKPATASAPSASESVAKSYILHSVENKLFNLADVNASAAELVKNRDLKNAEIARKSEKIMPDCIDALCHRFDEMSGGGEGDGGVGVNDENALTTQQHTYKWHSTPHHETANKPPPRRSFPQQPTPILLNRYLKHRHQTAETDNVRHYHVEALDGVVGCEHNGEVYGNTLSEKQLLEQRNEMNVSYVKYESEDCSKLPRIEKVAQNGLRSTFSKSDDVLNTSNSELNSTYSLVVEDDAASTASESSLSSMGNNKLTLSIQEVQKMADLQERSLKKQVYSSYYAGSSKSSEVSSSNESVSTYGALSNSNEGSIDTKPAPKIVRGIQPPKQRLSYARNPPLTGNSKTNSRISSLDRTCGKINIQPSKLTGNFSGKSMSAPANEIRPSTAYRSRISTSNGQHSNTSQSPVRKTQISTARPSTVPPKLVIPAESAEEIVSVKEIININTSNESSNAGPVSHIPRPASKIPMFRSSSSCNRFNKS